MAPPAALPLLTAAALSPRTPSTSTSTIIEGQGKSSSTSGRRIEYTTTTSNNCCWDALVVRHIEFWGYGASDNKGEGSSSCLNQYQRQEEEKHQEQQLEMQPHMTEKASSYGGQSSPTSKKPRLASPNYNHKRPPPPLVQAAIHGDVSTIFLLLKLTSSEPTLDLLNQVDDQLYTRRTAMHYACYYGHSDVVELLLSSCKDMKDDDSKFSMIASQDCFNDTPLHIACQQGYTNIVDQLLLLGQIGGGRPKNNHCTFFRIMKMKNNNGRTPFHCAVASKQYRMVKHLIDLLMNEIARDEETENITVHPISTTIIFNDIINGYDQYYQTPLFTAVNTAITTTSTTTKTTNIALGGCRSGGVDMVQLIVSTIQDLLSIQGSDSEANNEYLFNMLNLQKDIMYKKSIMELVTSKTSNQPKMKDQLERVEKLLMSSCNI